MAEPSQGPATSDKCTSANCRTATYLNIILYIPYVRNLASYIGICNQKPLASGYALGWTGGYASDWTGGYASDWTGGYAPD